MRAEARSRTPPTVGTHEGAGSQWCNRLLAEAKEVAFEALRCVVGGGVAVDGRLGGAGVRPGPDRAGSRTRQVHLLLLGPKRRARRPRRGGPDAGVGARGQEEGARPTGLVPSLCPIQRVAWKGSSANFVLRAF